MIQIWDKIFKKVWNNLVDKTFVQLTVLAKILTEDPFKVVVDLGVVNTCDRHVHWPFLFKPILLYKAAEG